MGGGAAGSLTFPVPRPNRSRPQRGQVNHRELRVVVTYVDDGGTTETVVSAANRGRGQPVHRQQCG